MIRSTRFHESFYSTHRNHHRVVSSHPLLRRDEQPSKSTSCKAVSRDMNRAFMSLSVGRCGFYGLGVLNRAWPSRPERASQPPAIACCVLRVQKLELGSREMKRA
ncbi:unnamed protein product [Eruca vesicaria subsp. sativa]|uniref:Uncharacterized protein n=1 Tax=Eruca vesicaria subsp. sativa TaxID=29727 RepID=A0ABC8K421_ERUVS|nr:unnamed protein product [Eruca vesicaria subsp. sativa]